MKIPKFLTLLRNQRKKGDYVKKRINYRIR